MRPRRRPAGRRRAIAAEQALLPLGDWSSPTSSRKAAESLRGFDAVLGNPPWDIAKPNSKEFFSNIDPLYRDLRQAGGPRHQTGYFAAIPVERNVAGLQRRSSEPVELGSMRRATPSATGQSKTDEDGTQKHTHDFRPASAARSFASSTARQRLAPAPGRGHGYADPEHPFRPPGLGGHQPLQVLPEQAHALLRRGRAHGLHRPLGPLLRSRNRRLRKSASSTTASGSGSSVSRTAKVFDIDSGVKFSPIVVVKGGDTEVIRTAFMQFDLEDWARAWPKGSPIPCARAQVEQFSPRSKAILEIRSARDLAVLEKIYANSVLVGDQGSRGWGIKYATEFHMTNDSALFPPRPKWEERGYRPDEYSRWIKGHWRPIGELWTQIDVSNSRALRAGSSEDAPFHNAPPYQPLPVPRADLPPGVILSRDMTAFINERDFDWELEIVEDEDGNEVEVRHQAVAVPLYEGRMIGQFDFSEKGWVSGKGRTAVWSEIGWANKQIEPQYLMLKAHVVGSGIGYDGPKVAYMRIASATNTRTMIATFLDGQPAGDSVFFFRSGAESSVDCALIVGAFGTFAYDFQVRNRLGGLNIERVRDRRDGGVDDAGERPGLRCRSQSGPAVVYQWQDIFAHPVANHWGIASTYGRTCHADEVGSYAPRAAPPALHP